MSEVTAARIANSPGASERGGESAPYDDWSRDERYERAPALDVDGRSSMTKDELIDALRST